MAPENLPADGSAAPWSCTIRLFEVDADGALVEPVPIEHLETDPELSRVEIRDGEARIDAGDHRLAVDFTGTSAPLPGGERVEIALEVTGRHG